MVDETTIATLILSGWTAVLAGATIAYAYFVRRQADIMREQSQILRVQTDALQKQMVEAHFSKSVNGKGAGVTEGRSCYAVLAS